MREARNQFSRVLSQIWVVLVRSTGHRKPFFYQSAKSRDEQHRIAVPFFPKISRKVGYVDPAMIINAPDRLPARRIRDRQVNNSRHRYQVIHRINFVKARSIRDQMVRRIQVGPGMIRNTELFSGLAYSKHTPHFPLILTISSKDRTPLDARSLGNVHVIRRRKINPNYSWLSHSPSRPTNLNSTSTTG